MAFVLEPKDLGKKDVNLIGGKGANLAELINADFPVPEPFFITAEAYEEFLKANDLKEKIQEITKVIDFSDVKSLNNISEKIKELIMKGEIPEVIIDYILDSYKKLYGGPPVDLDFVKPMDMPFVAVRSSGLMEDIKGASSAGQYETFLNIKGEKKLLEAVKKCWASLYTPRVMYYRNKNSQSQDTSISVVVQRMINSEKSGVAFTVDPTSPVKGSNHIIIEACWGLGETIVQGKVDPDHYVVDKDNGEILQKRIGKKLMETVKDLYGVTVERTVRKDKVEAQVLSDYEIVALAAYCKKIEQHYNFPEDIEWAIERGKIYIIQSRAVTTLEDKESKKVEGNAILKGYGASPGVASGTVRIIVNADEIEKIGKGDVLVTKMTNPDFVVAMEKSSAIVTDQGGMTCHAAIVSRELGIPCIVGTHTATEVLKEGMKVTVDATHGMVYEGIIDIEEENVEISVDVDTNVQVKVNLAFPETAERAKHADGVGLLRLEHMLTKTGMHPIEYVRQGKSDELTRIIFEGVSKVATAFYPKHVWVRSLDARTDEFRHMTGGENEPEEDNPMLGWHGIRRSLDEPEILKAELRALKQLHENGLNNVLWELPFIISVEELRKAKGIARKIGAPDNFGIMVEVPACALSIEDFCKEGIAFASFGSNDLTQTALGLDRNNERLMPLFDEMHPAMQFMFKHVIETCNRYNVESSICGELPSNRADAVEFLVNAGIMSISVNIDALGKVRQEISELERN